MTKHFNNYVYSLLYGEVGARWFAPASIPSSASCTVPSATNQGSLVSDLIEEYRAPFGDRLVVGMLGRGFGLELDKMGCFARLAGASWFGGVS